MTPLFKLSVLAFCVGALSGCFNGSSSSRPEPSVDFSTFVIAEIGNTNDTRAAVNINSTDFSFNDQNNPQAFDDLLQ